MYSLMSTSVLSLRIRASSVIKKKTMVEWYLLGKSCGLSTNIFYGLTRNISSGLIGNTSCGLTRNGHVSCGQSVKARIPFLYSTATRGMSYCITVKPNVIHTRKDIITCSRTYKTDQKTKTNNTLIYIVSAGVFMLGMAYAGVPLYRIFCQSAGLGGQAVAGHDTSKIEKMTPIKDRAIQVRFNADVSSSMQWNFRPQQRSVTVVPGETALAFYTARNPTDKPIIGISTYNVLPYEAGAYFNKIQCFCFEEQRLNPHEQVDMPVFFYIDPDFATDPRMLPIDSITLSYTFFEAKEGLTLPLPGYPQPHNS